MKKIRNKLLGFLFVLFLFGVGWYEEDVEAYTLNYSTISVSTYQGCEAKDGYYGQVGFINVWDETKSGDMKKVSYTVTKDGNYVTADSREADNYMNYCPCPVIIYGVGEYLTTMTVTDIYGNTVTWTNTFYILDIPPVISSHPSSKNVKEGTSVSFSTSVSEGTNVEYQWYWNEDGSTKQGYLIEGANSSTYTIPASSVTASINGRYYLCVIRNYGQGIVYGSGKVTNPAKLTVYSAPTVSNPSNQYVKSGTSATFSVNASGGNPSSYSYQWYYATSSGGSGTKISGATSSSYYISSSSVTSSLDGRYYYCIVSNGQYSVTSSRAKLTVYSAPTVSSPSDKNVNEGTSVTFSVSASGGNPTSYSYQWYYAISSSGSGTAISGATSSSYYIPSSNVTSSLDGRYYYCVVSNGQYNVTSNRAKLTVFSYSAPTVTNPSNQYVKSGTSATFSVSASGGNPSSYSYQWYYATSSGGSGTKISGATSSSYYISSSSVTSSLDGRYYYCIVSNGQYSVTSSRAKLTVYSAPTVSSPSDKNVNEGTSVTFSVSVSGGNPSSYSYQWYCATSSGGSGTAISGATSSSYYIPSSNVTLSLNGRYYYCVVSNGQYGITSNRALLTVTKDVDGNDNISSGNTSSGTQNNTNTGTGSTTTTTPSQSTGQTNQSQSAGQSNSGQSVPQTVIPEVQKPGKPKLTVKLISANAVKISWKKVTGADGYEVYRATSKKGKYKKVKTLSASKLSWKNTKLKKGKTYYYKVVAYKLVNGKKLYGQFSTVKKKQIKGALSTPLISIMPDSQTGTFTISWNSVKNAKNIIIYRSIDNGTQKKWKTVNAKNKKAIFSLSECVNGKKNSFIIKASYTVDGVEVISKASKGLYFTP